MKGEIAVMIAAKTGAGSTWIQKVVGAGNACYLGTNLKIVVSAGLSWIERISWAAVCTGIEMAAGASLHVIAACLHVPEKSFAKSDCRCFVRQNSIHAVHRRNGNAGKRRHGP